MTQNDAIGIDYSDQRLLVLVEEYITQQHSTFTLKGVCSYVLYWAMEEGKAAQVDGDLYESDKICQADCDRIHRVLDIIAGEGRIADDGEQNWTLMN